MRLRYIGTDMHYVGTSLILKKDSIHKVEPVKVIGSDLILLVDGERLYMPLDNLVHEWDSVD